MHSCELPGEGGEAGGEAGGIADRHAGAQFPRLSITPDSFANER